MFAAFFDRVKAAQRGEGNKPGYPRFKPYQRFSQVLFVAGDGAKWNPSGSGKWARATFQAVGTIKVRQHRPVPGTVKALQLTREHRRWYVIVIADTEPVPLPVTGRVVGVDLGVARFLTTSDGQVVANPRFLAASAQVIADLERRKARARPGSGNRKRLRRALAREWPTVRNRRRDFHHKTARALVSSCNAIALEDLNTAGMTKRPEPRPDPEQPGVFLPNRASAKAGLNKSILDAGWAQFAGILAAKAEEAGRRVVFVNPAGTSIGCHRCGQRCTRPHQKTTICPVHGVIDADLNGPGTSTPGPGWALVRLLRQLEKLPPSGGRAVTLIPPFPGPGVAGILAAAAGRSLVAVVRDAHRDQNTRSLVSALLAERPDLVLVEMGLPLWHPPESTSYLVTYGASRASAHAAAVWLGLA